MLNTCACEYPLPALDPMGNVSEQTKLSCLLTQAPLKPFLKWPGGKRWLIHKGKSLLPTKISGRYVEPFLGGGSIFFYLRPAIALLSDINIDLINTYSGVKTDFSRVSSILSLHQTNHSKDYYYKIRSEDFKDLFLISARFIYLNRTCFNGIYRVNRNGKFNVPLGNKKSVLLPDDNWEAWSSALQSAQLLAIDFESVIDQTEKGDFLFVDPPYTIHHNNNGYIQYNEVLFSWEDQLRLADALHRARKRRVKILMTNANHDCIHGLYKSPFKKLTMARFSSVSAKSKGRNSFEELIVTA
jgi:DNA adenine methylase